MRWHIHWHLRKRRLPTTGYSDVYETMCRCGARRIYHERWEEVR